MYKRVVILHEVDNRYAQKGTTICGMVRITGSGNIATVTTFVTNIDASSYGSWWVIVSAKGKRYSHQLSTFNNSTFNISITDTEDIACVLVKQDSSCHIVCQGVIGYGTVDGLTPTVIADIIDDKSPYEQLLAVTDNYYADNIQTLHSSVADKYRLVDSYSSAFERYYATGQGDNYYDSVKVDITKLFVQFPPHYPLMKIFADSFFVRIDFRDTDQYFAMGLIQQEGMVRYICYALPAEGEMYEDKDFSYIQDGQYGYYILYQDAINGQITTMLK